MPIPDFQTIMQPLLAFTSDNNVLSLRDTAENLVVYSQLIPDKKQEHSLPTGLSHLTYLMKHTINYSKNIIIT
jgi:restriction endonuclease Mrr